MMKYRQQMFSSCSVDVLPGVFTSISSRTLIKPVVTQRHILHLYTDTVRLCQILNTNLLYLLTRFTKAGIQVEKL